MIDEFRVMETETTLTITVPEGMEHDTRLAMSGCYDVPLDPPPRTFLDIGACYGAATCWAMKRWPGITVTAYEPITENFKGLTANVAQFGQRVTAVPMAVWAEEGRKLAYPGAFAPGEWTLMGKQVDVSKFGVPQVVECVKASDIASHEFVKIDAEGAEFHILSQLNLTCTRAISLEVHSVSLLNRVISLLNANGFLVHEKIHLGKTRTAPEGEQWDLWIVRFIKESELKPGARRLMFASPVYRLVPAPWLISMMRFIQENRMPTVYRMWLGDSSVVRARNAMATEFLQSSCTHLLYVDSDVPFTPEHVERIMGWPDTDEYGIVGGCYPKRQEDLEWVANRLDEDIPRRPDGLQQVRYVGTGFMRITRAAMLKMREKCATAEYPVDGQPDRIELNFFAEGVWDLPGGRRFLTEDWAFCQRWLDMGNPVWLDTQIILQHVGEATYPMRFQLEQIAK